MRIFYGFLLIIGIHLLLPSGSAFAINSSPHYEIAVIQIANSTSLKQRYINSINKASSDLVNDFKGINTPFKFSATAPTIKFEVYDIDTGKDCVAAHPEHIQHLKKHALLILGPVTSDCANALIAANALKGIPILNSLSTVDNLTQIAYSTNPGWFFRTASADHYRIIRLISEVKRVNNLPDLRSLNFGFVFDSKSEYSQGLLKGSIDSFKQLRVLDKQTDFSEQNTFFDKNAKVPHRVRLIDINHPLTCNTLPMPMHNLLIFMYSLTVQTLVEQINACHHQQGFAQPRYFAIGNPESFEFLPKHSIVISTPNLEQFEDTNMGLKLDDSAAYSSTTYMAIEALAQSISKLDNTQQPIQQARSAIRDHLADTRFKSMLANQIFQFNRIGDIESPLPHASVYRMKTDYVLVNRLKRRDSIFRLVNMNEYENIGWFDGDLLMKILVPTSYKQSLISVQIERSSDYAICLPFTALCWDTKYAKETDKVLVNDGIISTYHYTPYLPGEYTICLLDDEAKRVSNCLSYEVTFPKHLTITIVAALLVGLLLMEKSLSSLPKQRYLKLRYFSGIILTAFILHLFSVTFRNSDIASFLPFLSFSTNLITNAIIIGVLAGFNGLELIHLFVGVLQNRFFPKHAQSQIQDNHTATTPSTRST